MSDIVDSVNRVLQDNKTIETSSFYKEHQDFSKMYDSLLQAGVTQRRESQLKTIQDQGNTSPFFFNLAKNDGCLTPTAESRKSR